MCSVGTLGISRLVLSSRLWVWAWAWALSPDLELEFEFEFGVDEQVDKSAIENNLIQLAFMYMHVPEPYGIQINK